MKPTKIINIRGTSGSGKSTLIQRFIEEFNLEPATGTPEIGIYEAANSHRRKIKEYGYWTTYEDLWPGLAVVGDYENVCGGCDGITAKGSAQDEIQARIDYFAKANNVLFEGLLISHIYGRYRDMALRYGNDRFIFALMDTPLEVCKERINARRARKGKDSLLDHSNTEMMWEDVQKVAQKCKADGLNYVWLDHTKAYEQVLKLLDYGHIPG